MPNASRSEPPYARSKGSGGESTGTSRVTSAVTPSRSTLEVNDGTRSAADAHHMTNPSSVAGSAAAVPGVTRTSIAVPNASNWPVIASRNDGASGHTATACLAPRTDSTNRATRTRNGFTSPTKVSACAPRHCATAAPAARTPSDTRPSNSKTVAPNDSALVSNPATLTVVDPSTRCLTSDTATPHTPPTTGRLPSQQADI